MIECRECDGRGGFVIVDSSSPGCDETDDIEQCHKCKGSCHVQCEACDDDAEHVIPEVINGRKYETCLCESCFKMFKTDEVAGTT